MGREGMDLFVLGLLKENENCVSMGFGSRSVRFVNDGTEPLITGVRGECS